MNRFAFNYLRTIFSQSLIIFSFAAILFGQSTFENKQFKFSMEEPKQWTVITNEELKESLKVFDFSDETFAEMFRRNKGSVFLAAYVKYDNNKANGLNPKVQIDVLPRNSKDFQSFKVSVINNAANLNKYFENYTLIQQPQEVDISGIKSMFFIGTFTVKTQFGQELKVRSRVYAIPRKNYFFQISMVDGEEKEDSSKVFDELIKTVKIGN